MGRQGKAYPKEVKEAVIKRALSGEKFSDIAKDVGCARQTIPKWLDDAGYKEERLKRKQVNKKKVCSPIQKSINMALMQKNMSKKELAMQIGCSEHLFYYCFFHDKYVHINVELMAEILELDEEATQVLIENKQVWYKGSIRLKNFCRPCLYYKRGVCKKYNYLRVYEDQKELLKYCEWLREESKKGSKRG